MLGGFAGGGVNSITYLSGLSSDELEIYSTLPIYKEFAENNLTATNVPINSSLWSPLYSVIYKSNSIIEGLNNSTTIDQHLKRQLEGEALFVRAFCHFYLVNLFGDIPFVDTTDYRENSKIGRTLTKEVYSRIIVDLKGAEGLLSADYSFSKGERVRPNKWAASALLARVYLYNREWENAEQKAGEVIGQRTLFELDSLNSTFLKNSSEAIWQLSRDDRNTQEAVTFSTFLFGRPLNATLNRKFVEEFEDGDKRKAVWIKSVVSGTNIFYYPFKYQNKTISPITEYSMVLRVAEQYLIRAEARAMLGRFLGAEGSNADINIIRQRAGLSPFQSSNGAEVMAEVEREKKLEMFSEWGHRWMDLKRLPSIVNASDPKLNRADDVLKSVKPGYSIEDKLYPIPKSQITNNPEMSDAQNPGYD